jgi:hypothetical protein
MTAPPVMATAPSVAPVNTHPGCHPSCGSHLFHLWRPCPAMETAKKEEKKRAADAAWEEKKAAKKARGGTHIPLAGDWKCRCGFWNSKYRYRCRRGFMHKNLPKCPHNGRRTEEHIAEKQESGPGIEEHPPARCLYVNDWRCECGWWNREWHKHCNECGETVEEGVAYIAGPEDGPDGKLPHAPEKDDNMSEAQKRSRFFATHNGYWKKPSSQYQSR